MILIRIIAPDTVTEVHRLSALWANEAAPAGEIPDRTRWEPLSLVERQGRRSSLFHQQLRKVKDGLSGGGPECKEKTG